MTPALIAPKRHSIVAELVGNSPAITTLREQMARLLQKLVNARRSPAVLLQGETGTGKGLVARLLHRTGPRSGGPFVDVNCAAIPETLLEAELFGFERGAFTDARQAKVGLIHSAHNGVLFLDEIGLLPQGLQGKLLKVLEDGTVRRLGSTRTIAVDVWIIAATNEDLVAAMGAGRMRGDLYHRLAGVPLRLPPLRDRGDDIALLAERFLRHACADYGLSPMHLSADAIATLQRYPWPGNVRELANVVERAVLFSETPEITVPALSLLMPVTRGGRSQPPDTDAPLRATVDHLEREHLVRALDKTDWNISAAADRLRIPRNTLRYRMARYGLRPQGSPPRRRRTVQPEAAAASGAALERSELRQVVWLQTRLVDSTDAVATSVTRILDVVVEKVESFGGHVEETSREGIVAVFGLEPIEDAPRRAAHASMAILRALSQGVAPGEMPIAHVLAIHVAAGVIGEHNGRRQLGGESWHSGREALARLVARAVINQILVTAPAARLVERWFRIEAVPGTETEAHGPVHVLLGPRSSRFDTAAGQRLSRFVGRDREVGLLLDLVLRLADGRGQVIGLVGEPGVGKSRLLHEFRQHLGNRQITYLEGRCLSHGTGIPYLPVVDLLRRTWNLDEADTPETITATVRERLEVSRMDSEDVAPYLLRLFGIASGTESLDILSPEAIKRRTFDIVRQIIIQREGSVVLAVEDLHWVDKTSEDFFTSVVDGAPGAPLLFLSTYRPGYCPPWIDRSYVSQMALAPLSGADSRRVVQSILTASVSEAVIGGLVARGEGNPFFLEELALAVAQQHAPDIEGAVPQSIGEVLTVRIDRLPDPLRQVLESAAVLGREVPLRLLEAMRGASAHLADHLVELVRREFLHEQAGTTGRVYGFKHSLIQDVAYGRLPAATREALHTAIGLAFETLYVERLDEVLDRLAYHYARTSDTSKAVTYLTRFGEKAISSYSLVEAAEALKRGLTLAEGLPAGTGRDALIARVLPSLSFATLLLGQLPDTLQMLTDRQAFVERLNDPALSGPYYSHLALIHDQLGNYALAVPAAERALDDATKCGDLVTQGEIRFVLALESFWSGEFSDGEGHALTGISLLERPGSRAIWRGLLHWTLGLNRTASGHLGPALSAAEGLERVADTTADPRARSYAKWLRGWLASTHQDTNRGVTLCQEGLDVAPDPLARAVAHAFLGYAHLEAGDASRAASLLEIGVREYEQFRFRALIGWHSAWLSEAVLLLGNVDHAGQLAAQAVHVSESVTFPYGLAFGQRAQGRIALGNGALTEAVDHFRAALKIFSRIKARYEIARTQYDMADANSRTEKRQIAEVHLLAAKDLFQELGAIMWVSRCNRLASERRLSSVGGGE